MRYFLRVVEAKSITKAAEVSHVAQPALGMQIRNLEQELGVKLLVRHARGVVPTEAGERLAEQAEGLLRDFEQMRQNIMDIGGELRGDVALGVTATITHVLTAPLFAACRKKYSQISLNFKEGMSERLVEWVTDGRVDIALTYTFPVNSDAMSEVLAVESLYFAVPATHAARGASEITLREALGNDDIVFSSRSSPFRRKVQDVARANNLELRVVCEVNSVAMINELVSSGLSCAVMPYGAVRAEVESGRIVALPIVDPEMKRTLYLTYPKKRRYSKPLIAVRDEIRAIVDELIASKAVGWSAIDGAGPIRELG